MVNVVLTTQCVRKLKRELRAAGSNEIGGVLAAEQVEGGKFLVRDLSVQRGGTYASFLRDPAQHRAFIRRFHTRMESNPERFNYLGEWHSHPSFLALPSRPDIRQMQALVEDEEQASSFLVLMIVKLGREGALIGSAHAYRRKEQPVRVCLGGEGGSLIHEESGNVAPSTLRAWRRFEE